MKISNDKLMEILERNLGLPMGDGGIYYIQDPGQKRINKIYFSKDDMLLYKCTADTTDVTVTGNFKVYSLTNSDDYIEGLTGIGRGGVKYIQDAGTKLVNNVYIDKPTGKLYKCITQTASVNNDANFKEHNSEDIYYKLTNGVTRTQSNFTSSEGYAMEIIEEKHLNGKLVYYIANIAPIETSGRQIFIAKNIKYPTPFLSGSIIYVQHSLIAWNSPSVFTSGEIDAYSTVFGPSHDRLDAIGIDTQISTPSILRAVVHVRLEGIWK